MSDPIKNVEIEDVLSSIRRLVSDGDKARTRDPAPVEADADSAPEAPEDSHEATESKPDRFVLTPALMVVSNDTAPESDQDSAPEVEEATDDIAEGALAEDDEDDQDAGWVEELPDEPEAEQDDILPYGEEDETVSDFESDKIDEETSFEADEVADKDDAHVDVEGELDGDEDENIAGMVWGSVDEARKIGLAAVPSSNHGKASTDKATDRSGLIASIAELEAAVSKDVQDFEPDGSETTDDMMGETIAWPGTVKRNTVNTQDVEEAEQSDTDQSYEDQSGTEQVEKDQADVEEIDDAENVAFEHRETTLEETEQDSPKEAADEKAAHQDNYEDDDLDGLLDAGTTNLGEDALRALVSEVVREELAGPMGERITRNVRKLVRREIFRILSSQEFD